MSVRKNVKTVLLALLVMMLWGSLFPCIKLGYKSFGIDTSSVAEILMFAGIRFLICGAVITIIALCKGERMNKDIKCSIIPLFIMGLFAVVLHYAFTYVGLTLTDSSKTAILKQSGVLIYICFSSLFVKEEQFSKNKITGAVIGFFGIAAINSGFGGIRFSVGDILIILASVCTVVSNMAGKSAMKNNPAIIATGVSQLFGGVILVIAAYVMGAGLTRPAVTGMPVFLYICVASVVSYCLWNYIIRSNELSKMFIIKFAEPIFACVLGAILLGEDIFQLRYLAAFVLISAGIVIGNRSKNI